MKVQIEVGCSLWSGEQSIHVAGTVRGKGIIKPVIAFQGRTSCLVANLVDGKIM